jgi:RNase P protein component
MQVLAINSRLVLRATVRVKIKRRLKEAVKLIVTRGAAVEGSRKGMKVVFRAEDVGADKWITPGVLLFLLFHAALNVLSRSFGVITHDGLSRRLDVCCFAHIRNVPHVVCGIG